MAEKENGGGGERVLKKVKVLDKKDNDVHDIPRSPSQRLSFSSTSTTHIQGKEPKHIKALNDYFAKGIDQLNVIESQAQQLEQSTQLSRQAIQDIMSRYTQGQAVGLVPHEVLSSLEVPTKMVPIPKGVEKDMYHKNSSDV